MKRLLGHLGSPLAMLVVDSARACWELISKLSAVGIGHLNYKVAYILHLKLFQNSLPNCSHLHACVQATLLQLCLTLCDAIDCSPLGSSVHGILQARILEWVAMPFSR